MSWQSASSGDRLRAITTEYDRLAPEYDSRWRRYVEGTTHRTIDLLKPHLGRRFLDVGCGTGALLSRTARLDCRSAGCDLSLEMLRLARRRLPAPVGLAAADAAHLPFATGSFDSVASVSSFHYWPHPVLGLREVARVLRPGGTLVLTDWAADSIPMRLLGWWLKLRGQALEQIYRSSAMMALLDAGGFRLEELHRFRIGLWTLFTLRATRAAA